MRHDSSLGMTHDEFITWEERSALMEYDGGLSRFEAEGRAREIVTGLREPTCSVSALIQPGLPGLQVQTKARTAHE